MSCWSLRLRLSLSLNLANLPLPLETGLQAAPGQQGYPWLLLPTKLTAAVSPVALAAAVAAALVKPRPLKSSASTSI